MNGGLLTAREAAKYLACCEKTLWSLSQPRGDIPVVRFGRSVRYDVKDLNAWIEKRKGAAVSPAAS